MYTMRRSELLAEGRDVVVAQNCSIEGILSFPWGERSMGSITYKSQNTSTDVCNQNLLTYVPYTLQLFSVTRGNCSVKQNQLDRERDGT